MDEFEEAALQPVRAGDKPNGVIAKLNYSHEAMIDLILARPMISQGELARHFGYTEGWISQVVRSDAFREMVAARKAEFIDPLILQTIENRLDALMHRSVDVLMDKLDAAPTADVALKALEVTSRARGYGANSGGAQVNVNFVVAMPQKSENNEEWQRHHSPHPPAPGGGEAREVIDVEKAA